MSQPAADPRIVQSVLRFRNSILNAERQSATRLVNAYGAIYAKLQDKIAALQLDIEELGDNPTPGQIVRLDRYKELMRQTADEMNKYSVVLENELSLLRAKAIDDATSQSKTLVQLALPAMPEQAKTALLARFNRLPRAAVVDLLGQLQSGSPLADLLNEFGDKAAGQISDKLLEGVALGYNPRKTASMIRDALGGNLTRALTISRTETLRAYRTSTLANYKANGDVVKGWVWTTAKDSRTCLACLALDGREFSNDDLFMHAHPNCRCAARPKTVSYRDLGLDVDDPPSDYKTAGQWFEELSAEERRGMMSRKAFEAYEAGRVTLNDFVGVQRSRDWGDAYVEKPISAILGDN